MTSNGGLRSQQKDNKNKDKNELSTCMYDFNTMLIVWVSISNLRTKLYLKVILKGRVTKRERLK